MRRKRLQAALLAGVLTITGISGCSTGRTDTELADTELTNTEDATELTEEEANQEPLVIATSGMSGEFSGFYTASDADQKVVDLTTVSLLTKTRSGAYVLNGIEGETENYNGTDYTYYGIADCVVTDQEDGSVTYDFTLREDVKFSDGEPLTADDLIFSLYVYLDPAYEGECELSSLPIKGLSKYTKYSKMLYEVLLENGSWNTNFDYYSEEVQTQFFETDWEEAKSEFMDSILEHYDTDSVADVMVAMGIAEIRNTGYLVTYHTYARWSLEGDDVPSKSDLWSELMNISAYSDEVELMSADLVDQGIAAKSIFDYLPESYHCTVDTSEEAADSISGIKKTGDYSVRITLTESDTTALINLAIPIQAMHYYGSTDAYDYENHQFGFTKGDLSGIKAKSAEPLGAGPYVLAQYLDGTAYLLANEYYWQGTPTIEIVQLKEMSESDMAAAVANGEVDIAEPSITKSGYEQVCAANSNGTDCGDVFYTTLTDSATFGYIGMNVNTVSVGGDGKSEASIALRKAIATVISYYRYQGVYSYYGGTAELIEYPVSDSSWISPQEWENTFTWAYRYTKSGSLIYTTHSTLSERKKAVLKAALGYLEEAGYTVEDGEVTEAPEGAKLEYEVMITGGGTGDHPSYDIVKSAAKALSSIGITLTINDLSSSDEMFAACLDGTAEIWCAAWPEEEDPDVYMYALFYSEGLSQYMFSLSSKSLDSAILAARNSSSQEERKELYQKVLQEVADYAVMIPVYQRQNCTLYSAARLDTDSITPDQTSNYNWWDEIYLISRS